ncbi:MAG: cysteine-rich CWC family protein [Gammaproteobacteria bacterium]|nr:cysteine-rich CWC family protein [Gammaproteobacteria bacterium]
MAARKTKSCPRCQTLFECSTDSILICQCQAIKLSGKQRHSIAQKYTDCLCTSCLNDIWKTPTAPLASTNYRVAKPRIPS